MKIKQTLVLLLFITFATASVKAQTNWVDQQLDDRFAVKFPAKPGMSTPNGRIMYVNIDVDNVIYAANVIDFMALAQMDSVKLAPLKDTQGFADGLKDGMAGTLKGYELGDVTLGKWKGYTSYSIAGVNADKKTKIYFMIFLIGSKAYSLSCIVPEAVAVSSKGKDYYFASAGLVR